MPLHAEQLDAFWTVVQTGNYHRAADALFITQSAVTQRIQALEAQLGHKLLIRSGRTVTLTEAGQRLVRYCREQRQAETGLIKLLDGNGRGLVGRLAVAAGSSEGRTWLLPVLAEMGLEHPDLDIFIIVDDALDAGALLENCQADAILGETPLRRRGIRSLHIGTVPYGLAASPALVGHWPKSPQRKHLDRARIIDFEPLDRVTLDLLALCLPDEDFSTVRRHFVNDMQALIEWVIAGGGYSALPLPLIAAHLKSGKLRRLFPNKRSERQLYWSVPDGHLAPAVKLLMKRMQGYFSP